MIALTYISHFNHVQWISWTTRQLIVLGFKRKCMILRRTFNKGIPFFIHETSCAFIPKALNFQNFPTNAITKLNQFGKSLPSE